MTLNNSLKTIHLTKSTDNNKNGNVVPAFPHAQYDGFRNKMASAKHARVEHSSAKHAQCIIISTHAHLEFRTF